MNSVRLSVAPETCTTGRATGSACGAAMSSTPRSSSSARRCASSSSSCSCAYASRISSSSSPSSSASSMKARGSSSASLVSSSHLFYFFKGQAPGRRLHHLKRSGASCYSVLQKDLPGFLMGQDLSLDPLERVVNRLRVAAQLLCHLLVRRPFQVET